MSLKVNWWFSIWKLRIPPILKHSLWKQSHELLPAKAALIRINISEVILVSAAVVSKERMLPTIFGFVQKSREICKRSGFWNIIKSSRAPDMITFLYQIKK